MGLKKNTDLPRALPRGKDPIAWMDSADALPQTLAEVRGELLCLYIPSGVRSHHAHCFRAT